MALQEVSKLPCLGAPRAIEPPKVGPRYFFKAVQNHGGTSAEAWSVHGDVWQNGSTEAKVGMHPVGMPCHGSLMVTNLCRLWHSKASPDMDNTTAPYCGVEI